MERRSKAQVTLAVAGVLLGTVLQAVDGSIVNVAIPHIQRALGAPLSIVGWAITGYVLASLVAMPLAAALARRAGVRAFFVGSVALFTAASAACALSRTAGALIVFRVMQGLGAGGLLPVSQGLLMSLFPGRRGNAVALVGVAAVLGPLFGPPLGGLLTDRFGWAAIFWINLPLGALAIALLLLFLHAKPRPVEEGGLDLSGAALLTGALVCLQVACAHHPALLLPAAALFALFVRRERSVASPAVDLSVLRHRALAGTLVAAPLYGFGLYASVFLIPVLLEGTLSLSAGQTGMTMAVGSVASGAFIVCSRPLLERFGARRLCAIGAFAFSLSMFLFARVSLREHGDVIFAQALRGAGTGLLYIGMNGFAFEAVPDGELATSASLFYLLRQLGGSVGVALAAGALDAFGNPASVAAFVALALTAPLSLLPMAAAERQAARAKVDAAQARLSA